MQTTFRSAIAMLVTAAALVSANVGKAAPDREPMAADPGLPAGVDLQQRYGWTDLHWAARHGRMAEARRWLDAAGAAAGVDAREKLGRTPLHLAAMAGHREMVEWLLAHGADVNARDAYNVTPLRRLELLRDVRQWDRADIKSLLIDSGGVR